MASSNGDSLKRTARLFKIVTLIFERDQAAGGSRGRLGRPEMARICGCDTKTIGRDIDLLRTLVQIDYDRTLKAYTLSEKSWRFPVTLLTAGDVLALALARGLLAAPGLPHAAAIRRALDKTTAALPPVLRGILDGAADAFTSPSLPRDYSAAPVAAVMEAAAAHLTVEVDYESRSGKVRKSAIAADAGGVSARRVRRIDPYLVAPRDGVYWELHGWCHENAAFRTFALDRVHSVKATSEQFPWRAEPWARFEASRRAAIRGLHSSGEGSNVNGGGGGDGGDPVDFAVDVRFVTPGAAYARDHRWPPTLRIELEQAGDGSGSANVRLVGTIQSLDGMVAELLRWKRFAHVIGGVELRAAYRAELRAMWDANSEVSTDADAKPEGGNRIV